MPITLPAAARVPLVSIGAPRADSMSARVTLNPKQMPDIRLQVICPGKPDHQSVLILGEVHIRMVSRLRAILSICDHLTDNADKGINVLMWSLIVAERASIVLREV